MSAAYARRVTIVTPTYNAATYVRQCVDSVLAQTYKDFELVVVDDGSTDGTPDLVEAYSDPRVRCLRLPHRGLGALAATYNAALAASRGELVAVLEGDDYWPADKLELQVREFADPLVQLSWGAGYEVDAGGRLLRLSRDLPLDGGVEKLRNDALFRKLLAEDALNPSSAVMIRRAALDRIGGFRQDGSKRYVDLPTWLLVLARNPGVTCCHHRIVGFWRRYPTQTTARFLPLIQRERWRVVRQVAAALDADARAYVGWTGALVRVNTARRAFTLGEASLRDGRFARSRRLYASVLRDGAGLRGKALKRLVSSALGIDLSGAWRRLRGRP
jgi:glycosyltransferase involved in cell wall biosynthesis